MNAVWTITRKELSSLFQSPVALIFLGIHQLVLLFTFFSASHFFSRGLADVRPLFAWLPLLLIGLTATITMRMWAEERKLGTLEVLMTLPVRTIDLVLGKFFAATSLVAIALALTLPLVWMVSQLGELDWGPVIGGYAGALLLGAMYVSLGLAVSARTDNQVVSLLVTLSLGGLLYLVGSQTLGALVSTDTATLLRSLGSGSRFSSIERGVLDLRDVAYYAALTCMLLTFNVYSIEKSRLDPQSPRGATRGRGMLQLIALVVANSVLAVVWLSPLTGARIDLTERGEFTLSKATRDVLAKLDEPLFIDAYFSERTHPKLAPLVPQLRDLLTEYAIAGGDRVHVNFADPNADPDLEERLLSQYGIRAVPFQVEDRNQSSVVNSYFHVLVRYGDAHEVLGFDNLIEVNASGGDLHVDLRNPEYDITRAIKRASRTFQPLGSVLAKLPTPVKLTAFLSPQSTPADFDATIAAFHTVAAHLTEQGAGHIVFEEKDPSTDPALAEQIYKDYGIRPLAVDLLATQSFYLDVLLQMGDNLQHLTLQSRPSEAELKQALEAALRRLVPGQVTTVGLLTEDPPPPANNPQLPPQFQEPPRPRDYRALEMSLSQGYEVERVMLTGDHPEIPATIDVLVIGRPGPLSDPQRFAIDQYLMRGGRIIALASTYGINVGPQGLVAEPLDDGLHDLLKTWGVEVGESFVLDERSATFPRPVQERRGGVVFQRIELAPYPYFIDVRADGLARGQAATSGLEALTFPWASPLTLIPTDGVNGAVLAHTTAAAWTEPGPGIDPMPPPQARGSHDLAVVLTGQFPSNFAGKPNPSTPDAKPGFGVNEKSLPDARLAVIGSASLAGDLIAQLAQQPGGQAHASNLMFLSNLIDWSVEDTDLLTIRGSGAFARTLYPIGDAERSGWEFGQYGLSALLVLLIGLAAWRRRNHITAIDLSHSVEQA